jgi:ribosomal protein S14
MKKLILKDKKLREQIKNSETLHFILKSIFKNSNFFTLIRWKAFTKLKSLGFNNSKISVSPRCLKTFNRKKFNKLTFFSRHVFLKLIRSGKITGMKKASW